jgi:hypothetical protein
VVAVLVEGDERADGLRIGNALGHARMIPAAVGRSLAPGDQERNAAGAEPLRRVGRAGTRIAMRAS